MANTASAYEHQQQDSPEQQTDHQRNAERNRSFGGHHVISHCRDGVAGRQILQSISPSTIPGVVKCQRSDCSIDHESNPFRPALGVVKNYDGNYFLIMVLRHWAPAGPRSKFRFSHHRLNGMLTSDADPRGPWRSGPLMPAKGSRMGVARERLCGS